MSAQPVLKGMFRKEQHRDLLAPLLGYLCDRGWVSGKQLASHFQTTDRVIRAVASMSEGQIISGQRGYALISQAPVEEVQHAAAWLRSQARQMIQRAYKIEQAMHRRGAA